MGSLIERLWFQWRLGLVSRLRVQFLRLCGVRMGSRNRFESVFVRGAASIRMGRRNAFMAGARLLAHSGRGRQGEITIGSRNFFNVRLHLDSCERIEIGDDNMIGPDVFITDANHGRDDGRRIADRPMECSPVIIGNGVWVGAGAKILAGVRLGDGCRVGAGAVVTRSVEPGTTVVGIPARPLTRDG